MNLTKFVMQPSLHLHPFCGFKKIYFNFIKHSVVNIPDLTFVKFNQNHYVEISKKYKIKLKLWLYVLLVASQIMVGPLLLVNHLVLVNNN
jgi:hypothetical protein